MIGLGGLLELEGFNLVKWSIIGSDTFRPSLLPQKYGNQSPVSNFPG